MKKKILIVVLALVIIGGAVAFPFVRFMVDPKDTEEAYRGRADLVGCNNTIETAVPQTELYNMIKNHYNSPLPEGKTEKKAIIIGYDGCRVDVLKLTEGGIKHLMNEDNRVSFAYCGGVNYPEKNTQDTSTAPGWCSILTGVWADKHGVTANDITKSMEYKTLLTSLVEDKTIDSSMFITKWAGHFDRKNATYLAEKEYCEKNNLNVSFNKCDDDKASLDFTLNEIGKKDCADFLFVIYEQTDAAGHGTGFTYNNPKYRNAFIEMDNYGLETIKAIEARETYDTEDWLIIITSDHGGIKTNHGDDSIQERMTFFITNKNSTDNKVNEIEDETELSTEPTTFWEESTTKKPYVKPVRPTESTTNDLPAYVYKIKILNLPDVTTYYVGDEISIDGLKVQAYFHNGTSEDVSDKLSFPYGLDEYTSTPGVKRVHIEYVDFDTNLVTTYFTITVKEPPVTESTEPIENTENTENSETI